MGLFQGFSPDEQTFNAEYGIVQHPDVLLSAGFAYNITPLLQINPSAYLSSASPHKTYGYVALTWNITAFQ